MPFRFSRRIKIGNGFHINLSKSGVGFSQKLGPFTFGSKRTTLNLPGTGASFYVNNTTAGSSSHNTNSSPNSLELPTVTNQLPPVSDGKSPVSSTRKALNLITAFIVMFCCVCVALGAIAGGSNFNATPTPVTRAQQIILPSKTNPANNDTRSTPAAINQKPTRTAWPTRTAYVAPTRWPTLTIDPFYPTYEAMTRVASTATVPARVIPVAPYIPNAGSGSSNSAQCSCNGDTLNCSSFNSIADAQACFNYCMKQGKGDIHKLDGNNNGQACESK